MIFNIKGFSNYDRHPKIKITCPKCNHKVTLDDLGIHDLQFSSNGETFDSNINKVAGLRKCPNQNCESLIFFVSQNSSDNVLVSFPFSTIEFDVTDIPKEIVDCFTEALICHSNQCYVASAIMVRRTLEEICKQNGASGKNLKAKIIDLRSKITLSQELLDGLDELRILGNNAAHIEATEYDEVGKEEVEIAIDVTKEVLKSVYQHKSLVARLKKLKNSTTP